MRATTKDLEPDYTLAGTDSVEGIAAYIMLQRNLLYTAVTRAKQRCIIVGQWQSVCDAVAAWRMKPRYTRLKERIISEDV